MTKNATKKILCFGDSNVYGFMPLTGLRYLKRERWTGILQELCKNEFDVIEAGANNRTAFCDNPAGDNLTGYKALSRLLDANSYDIIILSVGANDLQIQYNVIIADYNIGLKKLINISKGKCPNAKIFLLSPSEIKGNILDCFFKNMFDKTSIEKSKQLAPIYSKVANETDCLLIDLNKIVEASEKDGLHYDASAHELIAKTIYSALKP